MRIPDHLIYGDPQACRDVLDGKPLRCYSDPRWLWPESPEPLPHEQEREQHFAVWLRGATTDTLLHAYEHVEQEAR